MQYRFIINSSLNTISFRWYFLDVLKTDLAFHNEYEVVVMPTNKAVEARSRLKESGSSRSL